MMTEANEAREALYELLDELGKPTATRWSLIGELADLILADEDGVAARDWFEHQSDEFRARFWRAYSELERVPLGIDDSRPDYPALDPERQVADYFDAEWQAGRSLLRSEKASRGNIGSDSAVADLNRALARETRLATRARRLHEALVVHDRRKVVVVWPKVARDKDSGWYSKLVESENGRYWHSTVDEAEQTVERLVAKLKAREVPVRVYRPRAQARTRA